MGRRALIEGAGRAGLRQSRLSFKRARRPPADAGGDGRPAAPDGGDPEQRPMQPRPPDLRLAGASRHRAPVRPSLTRVVIAKSDEAISTGLACPAPDCFASLAM